ncbi:MAG: hypothetical protein SPL48_07705, partial [Bacteroidales bacterium]|nr:hypothetical protein [Bacteroidales bacterium]
GPTRAILNKVCSSVNIVKRWVLSRAPNTFLCNFARQNLKEGNYGQAGIPDRLQVALEQV